MSNEFDYDGPGKVVPLNNVDSFMRNLEKSREVPEPAPVVYRQTTGPDLDQFLKDLEEGRNVSDSPAQVNPRRPNRGRIVARTKFRLVGGGPGPRAQPNVCYRQEGHYDALSTGPAPRPTPEPKKKLKGLL